MEFIELIIRIAGTTLLLVMTALLLRDARDVRPARFGALLAISLAAVLAYSNSTTGYILPLEWRILIAPISSSSAIFIWWFSLSLLDDDFRLRWQEWSVAALWTAFGLLNMSSMIELSEPNFVWAAWGRFAIAIGVVVHIVYQAIAGKKSDLIERRRRVRVYFACVIAFLFTVDFASEIIFGYIFTPVTFSVLNLSPFLAVVIWSVFWLLRLDKSVLTFDHRPEASQTAPALSTREKALHAKLLSVMEGEKAYLEPDLSIGTLANRVEAPEHQLRALINKSMGYRNFRAFLGGYRIKASQAALKDPEKAHLPILTIAMDCGYASLASFNRAFKTETGTTPSAFRAQTPG